MATSLAATIEKKFGITAKMKEGHNGIYEVTINGNFVYTNQSTCGQLPTNEEIFQEIGKYKDPLPGGDKTDTIESVPIDDTGCCAPSKMRNKNKGTREVNNMKTLKIKWQRLVSDEQTCPRCGSTEEELEKAISTLKQSLTPLGIDVALEKDELSVAEFKKDSLQSNQIWLNDRSLEDWIGGKVGQSPCCDVCGPSECRTVGVGGEVYEAIPADLIVKAGLLAASQLVYRNE